MTSTTGTTTTGQRVRCLTCHEVIPADQDLVHAAIKQHEEPVLFEAVPATTDLGNGWTRDGKNAIWVGEPRFGDRDVLRLGMYVTGELADGKAHLAIELGAFEDDSSETAADALESPSIVLLPLDALPELATLICRILDRHMMLLPMLNRLSAEREAMLQRLIDAAGGNMNATVAEAGQARAVMDSDVLCTICGKPVSQSMADLGEHRHPHCML